MKNMKIGYPKSRAILSILGLFAFVLGSFLIPLSQARADEIMPSVGISASPGTICVGQFANLIWQSADATSVAINPGVGSVSAFGNRDVSPSQTTTYVITGSNSSSSVVATASVTVTVSSTGSCQAAQNPTVTLTANPTVINFGSTSVLTWTSNNATSCNGTGGVNGWAGLKATTGSFNSGSLSNTTSFGITCTNATGSASDSATVTVSNQPPQGLNPTVNISADDTSIDEGDSTRIVWNSNNANFCTASGGTNGWSGSRGTSGSFNTGSLSNDVTYRISCFNNNGSANDAVTVRVNSNNNNDPTVSLRADNLNLSFNGSTTLRWSSTDADSCRANGGPNGWSGSKSTSGSFNTGRLTTNTTYRITCSNDSGTDEDSLTISVGGLTYVYPTPYQTPSTIVYQTPSTRPAATSLVLISSTVDRNQPIVPTLDNTRPHPGDEINYTVTYQNIGTGSINGLTLRIDLPLEVNYMFSNPGNPTISGNTLIFNLGTLRANGQGTVTVRVRVRDNVRAGTVLNFPAVLSYTDPSGFPQSVSANVTAQIWGEPGSDNLTLGANVFGAGFLPSNIFGWLLLLVLILVLMLVAKYLFFQPYGSSTTVIRQ